MPEAEARRGPTWAKVQALEKRLSMIQEKIRQHFVKVHAKDYLAGLSEAERAARRAEDDGERLALLDEYMQLYSTMEAPDFSGMTEAERAAEADSLRQETLQEARRLKMAGDLDGGLRREGEARIIDFDPKMGGLYFNRLYFADLRTFDHDEESPLGPMRFTGAVYTTKRPCHLCAAVNILSVKIACSDVGFPIHLYGTVIARDNIDQKCVYLFRRSRDHCQVISSKDEPLTLTGPKRGLTLLDDSYVEVDLKIKDHLGQDREFSKGVLAIRGIAGRSLQKCEVEVDSVDTRLSTVDVMYAVVRRAVEATIAVEVVRGGFSGTITAHTSSIQKRIVLYDSKLAGAVTGAHNGVIQLMRPVVSVFVKDMLIIHAETADGKARTIEFTPRSTKEMTMKLLSVELSCT